MLQNLKLKISLSLFCLLAIGMFLLALVIFAFWYKNITKVETAHLLHILQLEKEKFQTEQPGCKLYFADHDLKRPWANDATFCLSVVKNEEFCQSAKNCGGRQHTKSKLLAATPAGKDHIEFTGSFGQRFFFDKQPYVAVASLAVEGKAVGALALSGSLPGIYSDLRKSIKITLVYFLVNAFILTVVGFYRMVKMVIRPLEQVVQLADRSVDGSDPDNFFQLDKDEFGQLAYRLKQLIKKREEDNRALRSTVASLQSSNEELQKAKKEVVRAEKLASVGRLSAGLAHEVGNPLGVVKGYLDLLEHEDISAAECRQFAARAGREVVRMETIVGQLLDYSRQTTIRLTSVSLDAVLGELLTMFRDRKSTRKIEFIEQNAAPGVTVTADYDSLRQVFLNCLLNSIDAIEEKNGLSAGRVSVVTSLVQDQPLHQYVVVEISDNGVGIDSQQLDNVFDPFFTTKEPGKGTGLGLAVSYTLIEQFGGKMSLLNNADGGVSVFIELPCAENSLPLPSAQ